MLQRQRHEQILNHLRENDYLTVTQACQIYDASPATVRRDFTELANSGRAERVRGGVRIRRELGDDVLPFALRDEQLSGEKERIAEEAARQMRSGDVVFVDGGTTTARLVKYLPNIDLKLITNSLRLAMLLEERGENHSKIEVYLAGGYLYSKSGILLGPNAEANIRQYHADKAFLSVGGITERGISNTNELVMHCERAMISNANQTIILADHSKIGKQAMCNVAAIQQVSLLITDSCAKVAEELAKLEKTGMRIKRV